jgi:hypothetical protein
MEEGWQGIFFNRNVNENRKLGWFVHKRIISAVRRVEFVSDSMPYMILRGRCFDIAFRNVHSTREGETDDTKYE